TPWQIIHQLDPRLPLKLCLLPPAFLDYRLDSQGGYDVPRLPYFRAFYMHLQARGKLNVNANIKIPKIGG
ncbi:MAG: hypothetical protein ABSD45_17785, partial [Terriglobia bacterium]